MFDSDNILEYIDIPAFSLARVFADGRLQLCLSSSCADTQVKCSTYYFLLLWRFGCKRPQDLRIARTGRAIDVAFKFPQHMLWVCYW